MPTKSFLFGFALLCANALSAQRNPVIPNSLDFLYGQRILRTPALNGALNDFSHFSFGRPLTYVGVGLTSFLSTPRTDQIGQLYYTQVIPQAVAINDSTTANLTGFVFSVSGRALDLVPKNEQVDLLISLNFAMGRLRMYGNEHTLQKNPFFSPKLALTPRFLFGKFSFIIYTEYEFDVSKKAWKYTNGGKKAAQLDLSPVTLTGLTTMAGLGFTF